MFRKIKLIRKMAFFLFKFISKLVLNIDILLILCSTMLFLNESFKTISDSEIFPFDL